MANAIETAKRTAKNLDELAEILSMSREELDRIRATQYFPPANQVYNGKVWDVDAIEEALTSAAGQPDELPIFTTGRDEKGNSVLLIELRGGRFKAACPNDNPMPGCGKPHKTRVQPGGVKGRLRYMVCDTCGHRFQTTGSYTCVKKETLFLIRQLMQQADIQEVNGGRIAVFTEEAVKLVADACDRAIKQANAGENGENE